MQSNSSLDVQIEGTKVIETRTTVVEYDKQSAEAAIANLDYIIQEAERTIEDAKKKKDQVLDILSNFQE